MNIADEIKRLHELHQSNALTDAEFTMAKEKLLASFNSNDASASSPTGQQSPYPYADYQSYFKDDSVDAVSQSSLASLKHLKRSRKDAWLGGICGGLANFSGLASWVWRLFFVAFVFSFGIGIPFYLLCWIIIPIDSNR